MRIAYILHQYFPRHIGGTEVYTEGLNRYMKDAGHETLLLTYHETHHNEKKDFVCQTNDHQGEKIKEIHYNLSCAPNPVKYEYCNPFTGKLIKKELKSFQPDIVHIMHSMKVSGAIFSVCRALKLPMIVTLCDFWFICPRYSLLKWDNSLCQGPEKPLSCMRCLQDTHGFFSDELIEKIEQGVDPFHFWEKFKPSCRKQSAELKALGKRNTFLRDQILTAERVIALSAFQKEMFIQNHYPEDCIEVINHGISTKGLLPSPRQKTKSPPIRLGYIGSLVETKGVHVLLQALAKVPHLEVECLLYGQIRPEDPYYKLLLEIAHGDSRVCWQGVFPSSEMGKILAQFDLLVLPSLWYENSPIVVKSALYVGLPVLVSDLGSLRELVPYKDCLVPPGDVDKWAHALELFCQAPSRLNFDRCAIKTIEENAQEILAIYEEVEMKTR